MRRKHFIVQFFLYVLSLDLKHVSWMILLLYIWKKYFIFYTTRLLNHEFLVISGVESDASFAYHTLLEVGKFWAVNLKKGSFFSFFTGISFITLVMQILNHFIEILCVLLGASYIQSAYSPETCAMQGLA